MLIFSVSLHLHDYRVLCYLLHVFAFYSKHIQSTISHQLVMVVSISGVVMMAVFYLMVLGTSVWASFKSRRKQKKSGATGPGDGPGRKSQHQCGGGSLHHDR